MSSGLKAIFIGVLLGLSISIILFLVQKPTSTKKRITTEQIQNVRPGDFIRFGKRWYPVKKVSISKKENTVVYFGITATLLPESDIITLIESYVVDSVIYAPRDMDNNKWQKMALEYCISH